MSLAKLQHSFAADQSIDAKIHRHGQDFQFRLCTRQLRLGDCATVQYYWMDSRMFRHLADDATAANFQNCVGHWAACMRASRLGDDLNQQIHYVNAVCYALISNCKSLQDSYLDAYPATLLVDYNHPADDTTIQRVRDIVNNHDRQKIKEEFDKLLGRFEVPAGVLPGLQEAFRRWVGNGVVLLRQLGNDGLELFLRMTDFWLYKYRKRSAPLVRDFINLFAYEAKVSFYRCYANAWIDLIPWLRKNHGLDNVSERFMRFWHNQNQPIEIPHGQSMGGIHYPTRGRASVIARSRDGQFAQQSLTWQTPRIGPTHVRDVLNGQVLSLHPLSAFFMQDVEACAAAGRFFTSSAYEDTFTGRAFNCQDYWELVGAILVAAHRYRQALDGQEDQRKSRSSHHEAVKNASSPSDELSYAASLEDFAAHRELRCVNGHGNLRFEIIEPELVGERAVANYRCSTCHALVMATFDHAELKQFLFCVDNEPDGTSIGTS